MAFGGQDPLTPLNCGSLHLGAAQQILDLNDALAAWRGLPRDTLVGRDLDTLLSRGSAIYWEAVVEPLLEQQGHAWDLALKLQNQRRSPVEVLVNARRDENGTRCLFFPFSGRLLWERRLLAAQDQARRQRDHIERLERIERFRRDFINAIAHELITPVTPLRLQIHLLEETLENAAQPELQRSLEIIRSSLDRLSRLTNSMIHSAQVAAGRLDLKLQPIDLDRFLTETVHAWRRRHAPARPMEFDLQAVVLPADRDALTTCLENLLDNAVKFSPRGAPVKIQSRAGPPVQIIIEDEGRGIEPKRLRELGRPFAQAHDRSHVTTLGIGLGLYIVSGLMDAQGGRLRIESEGPGQGTRAILEFPEGQERPAAGEAVSPVERGTG